MYFSFKEDEALTSESLSDQLLAEMEGCVKKFCKEKGVSDPDRAKLLDHEMLNKLARNLGLNVMVESSAKQRPLGIEFVLSNPTSPAVVL